MSLFNVFDVSGSGMTAQSIRLNTTASNLANADTVTSNTQDVYRAKVPVFATALNNASLQQSNSQGVQVTEVIESNAPSIKEFSPDHPMADEQGFIYKPNVNVIEQMTDMMSASRAYQMNIDVAEAAKSMLMQTLRMGK